MLSGVSLSVLKSVSLVFFGCCTNVLILEYIIKFDNAAGNLITFAQFSVLALYGLAIHARMRSPMKEKNGSSVFPFRIPLTLKERAIPFTSYFFLVLMFWSLSVINNKAFAYDIPVPFHIIFRSGSLVASLVIGNLYLGKKYSKKKIAAVFIVTVGIIMATALNIPSNEGSEESSSTDAYDLTTWFTGVVMMIVALVLSAFLGCYQEKTYSIYGKHPDEMQFYLHFLSIPFFFTPPVLEDIKYHFMKSLGSERLLIAGISLPSQILLLIGNVLTQFICIKGVFSLLARTSSLTLTLTISIRKFVSLLVSIIIFRNKFTMMHWFSTFLVFYGVILYSTPQEDKAKES